MNCSDCRHWLIAAKEHDPLPSTVRQHLQKCRKCQRSRRRLQRLDNEIRELPFPIASTKAKQEFLKQLKPTNPAVAAPNPVWARIPKRVAVASLAVAAALLLFATGWFSGRHALLHKADVPQVKLPARQQNKTTVAEDHPESALLVKVAYFDVQLAETTKPELQVSVLSRMLDELLTGTIRSVGRGSLEKVFQLARLYEHVAERGIEGRVAALSKDERLKVVPPLVQQLHGAENKIDQLTAKCLPVVTEVLEPIKSASSATARRLIEDRPIAAPKERKPFALPRSALAILVDQGLRLAETEDPLQRAELCSELVPVLAKTVVMLSANGQAEHAAHMGESLGNLIDKGVQQNFRAAAEGMGKELKSEKKKLNERVGQALTTLRQNFDHASPAAREGMKQALESAAGGAKKNDEKANGKSDRKGPPWLRDKKNRSGKGRGKGRSNLPPGWLKKFSQLMPQTQWEAAEQNQLQLPVFTTSQSRSRYAYFRLQHQVVVFRTIDRGNCRFAHLAGNGGCAG